MIDEIIMYEQEAKIASFKRINISLVKMIYPKLISNRSPVYFIRPNDLCGFDELSKLENSNWTKEGF